MMRQAWKILLYEIQDLSRSRWFFMIGLFFFVATEAVLRFGSDPTRAMVSLMNIVLIVIPFVSLLLGVIHFYHSREFMELLLAQPVDRGSIFLGKFAGLCVCLSSLFLAGTGLPFVLRVSASGREWSVFLTVLAVGCAFVFIFTAVAFLVGSLFEDRLRGFGTALILWLYLSIIHDALILLAVYVFREYPLERGLIGLALLNPVDLGRILILLRLDISALMGYTGAVFRSFFGSSMGIAVTSTMLALWLFLPAGAGLFAFRRKDF